ncbi:MAG: hypothetical protein L6R36_005305 [Xanthoria steineri]|nr:MAG: hypothetical protein L6R36_005305 [Xanthoria steineri]
MAEEVRPFYASTDKTKCNKCRVFQDPFDMCEELRESFTWALFIECYKDLPCPTKRDAMPQPIPGTDSKDKLHAPELNPGEKGQKLSQESEIETSTGADGGAELIPDPVRGTSELRPRQIFTPFAHQNPKKAVQEAAKAGQEIIEDKDFHGDGRCWVLHGNTHDCRKKLQDPNAKFQVAPFYDCYEAKKCPKKRSRIPDAPELNSGAKGQKLSQRSEIDARAALAVAGWNIKQLFSSAYLGPRKLTPTDAVPDPTDKDANIPAAAVYDAAKETEHKIINGRLEEPTDTEIAERDAIPASPLTEFQPTDLPTHLDEEYYRYTERQIANPNPTASHPNPAPKPEIRRAWGKPGIINNAKPKSKPPHPAQSRSRRAWGGAGMIKNAKPKTKPPHPAHL